MMIEFDSWFQTRLEKIESPFYISSPVKPSRDSKIDLTKREKVRLDTPLEVPFNKLTISFPTSGLTPLQATARPLIFGNLMYRPGIDGMVAEMKFIRIIAKIGSFVDDTACLSFLQTASWMQTRKILHKTLSGRDRLINTLIQKNKGWIHRLPSQLFQDAFPDVRSLDFSNASYLTTHKLALIVNACRNLEKLNLSGTNVSSSAVQAIQKRFPDLQIIGIKQ